MKLLGYHNDKQIVASVSHYDCRSYGEGDDYIMADGGQIGLQNYAGYSRKHGKCAWFEVPQTFADLYNDYQYNEPRKYGIWNLSDVRILDESEYPDVESFEWRAENAIWGTNGPNGDLPTKYVMLKDCEPDHLANIKKLLISRRAPYNFGPSETEKLVDYWLERKCIASCGKQILEYAQAQI